MRLSTNFVKTRKQAPSDEEAKNAQLLIRAGYIHKEMAGVYDYLPLGLKVVENIKQIVREEMDSIGGQELLMSSLQRKDLWERTDRWSDEQVDVWFKSQLANGSDVGFGWSHEEPITDMMTTKINSYRDLPVYVYQFQNKLRNELRAKSGIMRGREFLMKDLYSYSIDDDSHQKFYDAAKDAYMRVFDRLGIGDKTFLTFASGGDFTQFSHEFQTICDAGEDIIYLDQEKQIAVNKEVLTEDVLEQLELQRDNLEELKAVEVGNIFSFGTAKSEELNLAFTDEGGQQQHVVLGSYGIGITRVMGVIAELMADDDGLIWPTNIAPARVHLVSIGEDGVKQANTVYDSLLEAGVDVIYDDRDISPGAKLADADLIGVPIRVVASQRTAKDGVLEVKTRAVDDKEMLDLQALLAKLSN
jgi:prolyl-tRNA synthetase